jgi:hypothetical protein
MIFASFTKTKLFDFSIFFKKPSRCFKPPSRSTHLGLFTTINLFSTIGRQTFNIQGPEYLTLRAKLSFLGKDKGAAMGHRFQNESITVQRTRL